MILAFLYFYSELRKYFFYLKDFQLSDLMCNNVFKCDFEKKRIN